MVWGENLENYSKFKLTHKLFSLPQPQILGRTYRVWRVYGRANEQNRPRFFQASFNKEPFRTDQYLIPGKIILPAN